MSYGMRSSNGRSPGAAMSMVGSVGVTVIGTSTGCGPGPDAALDGVPVSVSELVPGGVASAVATVSRAASRPGVGPTSAPTCGGRLLVLNDSSLTDPLKRLTGTSTVTESPCATRIVGAGPSEKSGAAG